ncbi:MAG: sulfatase [Verrucomicrobiota bacterium]|nr:sulfatase [Verrucomicrobiota bacterium]
MNLTSFTFILVSALTYACLSGKTEQPNVLWITSEDNSIEWVGCYGSKNAKTPNIDQLAKEGFRYLYCFDNGAVCAPTRSSWITGMHAISNGTQPMRSGFEIPDSIRFYNELLQEAGYYTSNCSKTDYNLRGSNGRNPKEFWNYSGGDYAGTWKKREKGQPFFTVYNIGDSHESRAFGDHKDESVDPKKMILAPYHPDLPEMRNTYAKYASAISKMDSLVGQAIENLKRDNLYENTIVIYNSDHGGVLARSKRFLYSSGIHCPLIVRIPAKWNHLYPQGKKPGSTIDRIVSFIDMPKTWVSLTGAAMKKNFQGRIFLGPDTEPPADYHFSWRERADERFDNVRVIRDEQFAYHKNYAPFAPNGQYLAYMHNMKATGAWERHHQAGKTNAVTGRFFEPRPSEEFYDNFKDFHNVDNQIDDPLHQSKIKELKKELRRQQLKYFDSGLMPEEMRNRITKEKKITVYAFVRDPKLYPLPRYLDYADLALARKKGNLKTLSKGLHDSDPVIRYWSVVGLLLLEKRAQPALPGLKKALNDSDEIPSLAAWAIFKAGEKDFAKQWMLREITENPGNKMLANVLDWMDRESFSILARIPQEKLPQRGLLKDVVKRYRARI